MPDMRLERKCQYNHNFTPSSVTTEQQETHRKNNI